MVISVSCKTLHLLKVHPANVKILVAKYLVIPFLKLIAVASQTGWKYTTNICVPR